MVAVWWCKIYTREKGMWLAWIVWDRHSEVSETGHGLTEAACLLARESRIKDHAIHQEAGRTKEWLLAR